MRHYKRRAQVMLSKKDAAAYLLDESRQANLITQHSATPKEEILDSYMPLDFASLSERMTALLSSTVVSAVIQSLKEDPEASEWVHDGLGLHKRQEIVDCLFCGQSLPSQRLSVLEEHFNTAYEDLVCSLDELTEDIDCTLKSVAETEYPDGSRFLDQFSQEYEAIRLKLKIYRGQASTYLESLKSTISKKRNMPFERVAVDGAILPPDCNILDSLNEIIQKHNSACRTHAKTAVDARSLLESGLVAEELDVFKDISKHMEESDASIQTIEEDVNVLQERIVDLEAEITEHRRPAEELNQDLRTYLGHGDIQLAIQDRGYAIIRNGVSAHHLSEGETTAIALLYFLKSLEDHRFDIKKGIVVLDDPVSSLDAGALFLAHGFIQNRTKDAGQLFIFTHNLAFLRQTRNWFRRINRGKKDSGKPARLYTLNCVSGVDGRRSSMCILDPILECYESDYHYLFACIWRGAKLSAGSLKENYSLPNMARTVSGNPSWL